MQESFGSIAIPQLSQERKFEQVGSSTPPNSVSVCTLLKAKKLVRSTMHKTELELKEFDVKDIVWRKSFSVFFEITKKKFGSGCFHDAFEARLCSTGSGQLQHDGEWVLKKYHQTSLREFEALGMTEEHARKQVQSHAIAEHVTRHINKLLMCPHLKKFCRTAKCILLCGKNSQ